MGSRGRDEENRTHLAIRTTVDREDARAGNGQAHLISRETSPISSATSADHNTSTASSSSTSDHNTRLSSSAFSTNSTTYTSAMSDDDRNRNSIRLANHHPTSTILDLVSNAATSSALPETFGFAVSRKGSFIAIFCTSNIWLIDAVALPRLFARTLEIRRKPVTLDLLEDGSLLAVLSTPTKIDVYSLPREGEERIEKKRTILLEHEARTVALSPQGHVLAAGHKHGMEVISIGPNAMENNRRSVSGQGMDCLEFSDDGRTLLATSTARKVRSTTVFSVHNSFNGPFTEDGEPILQEVDIAWSSQILFPDRAIGARHATLLPDRHTGQINELFAIDSGDNCWGIYDLAAGSFTEKKSFLPQHQSWTKAEFIDDAIPAVSRTGDHAAVALCMQNATTLWLYRLPDSHRHGQWKYEDESQHSPEHSPLQPCLQIPILQDKALAHQEIAALRWLKVPDQSQTERLIAVGNTTFPDTSSGPMPTLPQGSTGVVVVMDFDYSKPLTNESPVPVRLSFDLDSLLPGEKLPEEDIEFDREVELVRSRTIAQRRAAERATRNSAARRSSRTLGRSQTTSSHGSHEGSSDRTRQHSVANGRDEEETLEEEEAIAAFEVPYDHSQPRSQMSLQRAATVAAVSPANRRHLRSLPFRPLEYRRADGMREFPHESDADDWVPPPPPYTPHAEPLASMGLTAVLGSPATPPPAGNANGVSPVGQSISGTHNDPASQGSQVPQMTQMSSSLPYSVQQGSIQTQSTSDLSNMLPLSNRPTLLHPSTYPTPQSPPGSSHDVNLHQRPPPGMARRRSSRQQTAYQATSHVNRASIPDDPSFSDLGNNRQPPLSILRAASRRGSAPDTSSGIRRHFPTTDVAANHRMSVPYRETPRVQRVPLLSVRPGVPASGDPRSAPPQPWADSLSQRPQHRRPSRLALRSDQEESWSKPGQKKLHCAVM